MFSEVKLKRDGWHRSLQMWTFGWEFDYQIPFKNNFCPYFWLTIFCLIASPITLILKGFITLYQGASFIFDKIFTIFDKLVCDPLYSSFIGSLPEEEVYRSFKASEDWYSGNTKQRKQWDRWKELNKEDWKNKLEEIKKRYIAKSAARQAAEREASRKAAEREASRKAMFGKIIKYTKFLTPVLLSCLGVGVLYGLYRLGLYLYTVTPVLPLETILLYLGYGIGGILALVVIISIVMFLVKLYKKCSITIRFPIFISKSFSYVTKPIRNFFSFFVDFFVAYKENNCPAIKWED